jgi:hypothetical protein
MPVAARRPHRGLPEAPVLSPRTATEVGRTAPRAPGSPRALDSRDSLRSSLSSDRSVARRPAGPEVPRCSLRSLRCLLRRASSRARPLPKPRPAVGRAGRRRGADGPRRGPESALVLGFRVPSRGGQPAVARARAGRRTSRREGVPASPSGADAARPPSAPQRRSTGTRRRPGGLGKAPRSRQSRRRADPSEPQATRARGRSGPRPSRLHAGHPVHRRARGLSTPPPLTRHTGHPEERRLRGRSTRNAVR